MFECSASPCYTRRRSQRWLGFARRSDIGRNADCTADRIPDIERGITLLVSAKYDEAQDEANADQRRGRPPSHAWPRAVEPKRAVVKAHCRTPMTLIPLVTSTAGTECCLSTKNCAIG